MTKILLFLASMGCVPDAFIIPSNATFYIDGVVYIRPDMMQDHVIVHELVHDCQYDKSGGGAKTWAEHTRREYQAKQIETQWIEMYGINKELRPYVFQLLQ